MYLYMYTHLTDRKTSLSTKAFIQEKAQCIMQFTKSISITPDNKILYIHTKKIFNCQIHVSVEIAFQIWGSQNVGLKFQFFWDGTLWQLVRSYLHIKEL